MDTDNITKRNVTMLPLSQIETNNGQLAGLQENPRSIKKHKYEKLKQNIVAYPEMLEWRSLLVYPLASGKYIIIGGNMRYRAMLELGHIEAPVHIIPADTPVERLRAYTILDNNGFGDWDWDLLANQWDEDMLADWGLDLPNGDGFIGEEPGSFDGEDNDKPFVIKLTFADAASLNDFRNRFDSVLRNDYDVSVSVSGGKL